MTVSTINSVAEFVTNGATKTFPFYFKFLDSRDLVVTYIDPEDVSTVLVMGTQYTVSGAGNDKGGSVTTTAVLRGPGKLIVSRDMEAYQKTSLRNQGKFLAETHEDVFDRLTMLVQQGFAIFKRALTRPFGRDYFYAEGRRITDVANPKDAQDAATKGYTDTLIADVASSAISYTDRQMLRTVRSADGETLTQLPPAESRANKVMGFNAAGQPIGVLPASGSGTELAIDLANAIDPVKGSGMIGWTDPVAPQFLKTVSDMKAGEPVNLFRLVPKAERSLMQNGTSTYDCAPAINEACDLFHRDAVKGGVLEVDKGKFNVSDLNLRGGFTMRGAGRDVSTMVISDLATVRLSGLGNTIERMCFHKDTPRENYITAGHKTDAGITATLSEIGYCKFTAGQLDEFVNYALIANYRSRGINVHDNRMFTYHLAFLTKYLVSDWVRLHANWAVALNSANVFNSELFKIEAINQGWVTENQLFSEGVEGALSCLTIESGTTNLHVRGNTMRSTTGYAVRVEHTDKTITPPTDCMLEGNTLIAGSDALAVYSGSAQVSGLTLSGGTMTGPVTLYGTGTNVDNLRVRAGRLDPRTGVTLRGDNIKIRNLEVTGFGVGLANAAVEGFPDRNLDIQGLKMSGQTYEAIHLKYLAGSCYLGIDSVSNTSRSVNGAIYLYGGGESAPADMLTVEPGNIVAQNTSGVTVEFMNGVTLGDCSGIKSPSRVKLITTDAFLRFESTFIAANFTNKSHRVNTSGKFAGKVAFNKDPRKPYYATGSLPTDVWVDAAGVTTYTPV